MRRFFTASLFLLLTIPAFSQSPCDDEQVTLSSQADVDNFPTRYCSTLCQLTISGSDITNLDSLYVLRKVGQLVVQYNPALVDIDGLSNITAIQGTCGWKGLTIEGNNLLENLDGLSSLTIIEGALAVSSNTMLSNLDGLSNVSGLVGGILIRSNASLTDLSGLNNITTASSHLAITNNPGLLNLEGLNALKAIDGYIDIEYNPQLTNITALSNLEQIGQWTTSSMSLVLSNNESLLNLDGLEKIDTIPGTMFIENNPSLVNINGLSSVTTVFKSGSLNAGIQIANNASLENISGLSSLAGITGARGSYLHIQSNPLLEELQLNSLTEVQGNLVANIQITDNASLRDLDGFSSFTALRAGISVIFEIADNPKLDNIDGLSSLSKLATADPEEAVKIVNNTTLGRFCGLFTLFNSRGIGCGSPECYTTNGVMIEGNERNPTPEEIEAEGPCDSMISQPTNLVFSNVSLEGMQLTFNNAPGFTSGYVVLMKAYGAPAPEDVPADGTGYHVGEVIGSSTIVVHTGTDTTFYVSGLIPSVPYYFDVFSYKVTESGNDYLAVNPLEGRQTTTEQSQTMSAISFTNVDQESMTVVIDEAEPGNYLTLMKAFGYPSPGDVPKNGKEYNVGNVIGSSTIVVNKGDGSEFTVTGLMPDTQYYFDVYKYDPATFTYAVVPRQGNQSTSAEEQLVPYPNPVVTSTSIPFRVKGDATVQVVIYDMTGREVGVLASGEFSDGVHEASWDGADSDGRRVQPGVYVYSVKSDDGVVTGRLSVR
ncbi:MAG TPA: FlgD immunoglobulin-like domain containing protein [Cyclobacteriaceae bacterium]|nr:FlgD immunoglobulin-like domain containing protein [Cyclobacteriaceae bacterium]